MKRSEMLDKIEDTLRRTGNYCDGNQEVILYIIEKAGMLPPNDGKKRYIKKSSVPCVINARNCHQWGAEDE